MKKSKFFISILIVLIFVRCEIKPKNINYGHDNCDFCRMTVVNKIYGAEIVTKKGKVLKFDAIECMIRYLKQNDIKKVELFLVNVYTEPEVLVNAKKCIYLISQNLPSPMGAYLTAFKNREDAEKLQLEKGGDLYNWEELLDYFEK